MSIADVDAMLTQPGGFFETATESVNGEDMTVIAGRMKSLREMLAASANHDGGNARYYVFDDGREATYAHNIARVASIAAALRDRHGIGHGDRVAILAANCPEWIETFWATVSLGAIAVAMNGWWIGDEIRHGLELTTPKLLVTDRRRFERLESHADMPTVVIEDQFEDLAAHAPGTPLPDTPIDEDDPAAILFTSGTTGRPKGSICTHRNFIAYVGCAFLLGARDAIRFPAEGEPRPMLALAASPLFHISGLHSCAVTAVASGSGHVWTTGRFDPEKVLQLTEQHGITRWGGVTTQIWRIIEHPKFGEYDTSSVTSIGGGGSVWTPELLKACRAALPHAERAVGVGYGLTECSGLATHAPDDLLAEHPDSVGTPLPTVELRIADDNDTPLPDGEIGNVCLRGPMVTPGYWHNPEATAATIRPGGWLLAGDYGHVNDGLLFLDSRRSELIIRGGENIYPAEIETRLDDHPDIHEAAVFGVEHRELGHEVKAVIVPNVDASIDLAALEAWLGLTLSGHKIPAHWEVRTEPLPRNASGKIMKKVLTGESVNTFIED